MHRSTISKNRKEYIQGFAISLIILFSGSILEWVTGGQSVIIPSWPMNAFVGISYALILVFLHFFYSDLDLIKWLSRIPASISSIVLFTFLTLILGLTKQNNASPDSFLYKTGLNHIRNSYTFLLSGMYLLTTLGLVILRRSRKLSFKNVGFMLNHLGLWLIVLAGSLGAGDLQRLQIYINENEKVWYGFDTEQKAYELPFTLKLLDFDIDYFAPKLAYIQSADFSFVENIDNNLIMIEEGMEVKIANWKVRVNEFLPEAGRDSLDNYIPTRDTFSVPAVNITAEHLETGELKSGFISCGGIMSPPSFLPLDERYSFAMTQPEPREYKSFLEITRSDGSIDSSQLIVNHPIKVSGWNLYQLSYNQKAGKWSRLSIIEAIRDPWLAIIYTGIFMVIGGALYLFTIGKKPKEE